MDKNKPELTDDEFNSIAQDLIDGLQNVLLSLKLRDRMKDKHLNPNDDLTVDECVELNKAIVDEALYKMEQFKKRSSKYIDNTEDGK
jgi:signal transduction histidine kinase